MKVWFVTEWNEPISEEEDKVKDPMELLEECYRYSQVVGGADEIRKMLKPIFERED